jgi:hypothetical protein
MDYSPTMPRTDRVYCRHCSRRIYMSRGGRWLDLEHSTSGCNGNVNPVLATYGNHAPRAPYNQ